MGFSEPDIEILNMDQCKRGPWDAHDSLLFSAQTNEFATIQELNEKKNYFISVVKCEL